MNFEETIPYLFAQISTAFKINLEKYLSEIEVHSGQVFILFELWKSDGLSQVDLSNKLRVSAPTINKMVKSLAENDFVVCGRCHEDGRLMRIFLTKKGSNVRPRVEQQWNQIEERIVSDLTETEKLVLFQLFRKLRDCLMPLPM